LAIQNLNEMNWRLLDHTIPSLQGEVLLPFAIEEMECDRIAAGEAPLLHIWRHEKAFVLGLRDRRLPHAEQAMETLRSRGWSAAVRNSGGAAVPLDSGVVNVSLVLPSAGSVNLNQDFKIMAGLISDAVKTLMMDVKVNVGEVEGAYCPGEYDLSIGGYKFCGIAQRRKLGAYVIQAFIVVEGAGALRAQAAATFYTDAAGGTEPRNALLVEENSTKSLQELLGGSSAGIGDNQTLITAERFTAAVKKIVLGHAEQTEGFGHYRKYDAAELERMIDKMKQRYDSD
jgi:octanoyl-[GcvH]:protein N-octanoyltransferase